ncbi:hypothetical protein BU24DRAFT_380079 [Aaosphaeria arxii CBS 175.79]|uniref:Mid2 domain-containing protein n=1 Tax=Aaosphaeria arxii CBS 175.79 TaxID=1450172 RepID=A0A6A5X9H2_9PLEO|nr:uncharacterized protein BU24DRAFT_380079 [Aaosphaeria arxii CBS 175.79]KAF2009583.1 hypothetical protein BU24DRAFT_380079 [Aaosphaeria arxii CBS 175.79]
MLVSPLFYALLSSFVFANRAAASVLTARVPVETNYQGYNGGVDNPQDPSEAGAEGASKGAFNISKGGLIAIIVVAVLVAVAGGASAVLFWLAKKRQWDVRQSLRRASRRLTGRGDVPKRPNRRTGVRLDSPPPSKANRSPRDIEKGLPASSQQGRTTTTITSQFDVETPTSKGWKAQVIGGKK